MYFLCWLRREACKRGLPRRAPSEGAPSSLANGTGRLHVSKRLVTAGRLPQVGQAVSAVRCAERCRCTCAVAHCSCIAASYSRSGRQYSTLRAVALPAEAADVATSEAEGPTTLYQSTGVRALAVVVAQHWRCGSNAGRSRPMQRYLCVSNPPACCHTGLDCFLLPPTPAGAQSGAAGAPDRRPAGLVRQRVTWLRHRLRFAGGCGAAIAERMPAAVLHTLLRPNVALPMGHANTPFTRAGAAASSPLAGWWTSGRQQSLSASPGLTAGTRRQCR